jgi:hypothetical protein
VGNGGYAGFFGGTWVPVQQILGPLRFGLYAILFVRHLLHEATTLHKSRGEMLAPGEVLEVSLLWNLKYHGPISTTCDSDPIGQSRCMR